VFAVVYFISSGVSASASTMRFFDFLCATLPLVAAIPSQTSKYVRSYIAQGIYYSHPYSQDNFGSYFYKGHDLSSLKTLEDTGGIFKDTTQNNRTRPAEDILGDGGMNTVRLRIWVNPESGTNGLQYNLELAKRFQRKGYKLYLDFHFS
jgi:arabinogalactan endo-1,4-beta-galactosidase